MAGGSFAVPAPGPSKFGPGPSKFPSFTTLKDVTIVAVKLRLMRMGKKKQPTYRVVAADARSPRNGRFIEIVGTYQPRLEPSGLTMDNVRALHWLRHGAKPTERVERLLKITGAWDHFEKGTDPDPAAVEATDTPEPATAP